MNADDQRLITECLEGRTEAFGDLVLRHQNRLHNTLAKMLGSVEDARDISQEAFVLAFTKLDTFRGESAFYSWLFRIAYNVLVSRKRKKRRATTSLDAAREKAGVDPTDSHPETHPSHAMELAEQQTQVRRALAELSEEYREVLVLKEMENLSYEEIAEIVGCPIGTVRSRIHRGRTELREKLRIILQPDSV